MSRHVILEDQDRPIMWIGEDRPHVSPDDWRALIGLLLFIGIVIAMCAVTPP